MGVRVVLLLVAIASLCGADFQFKRLAGPPSEFEGHRIPSPVNAALSEESALIPVRFQGEQKAVQKLAVDSKKEWQFVFYVPEGEKYTLELHDPQGQVVDLAPFRVDGEWPISSTGQMVQAEGFRFTSPFARGFYELHISMKDGSALPVLARQTGHPSAYVFLWNDSPELIFSHLSTYWWDLGKEVGVTAQLFDATAGENVNRVRGQRPSVLNAVHITSAKVDVYQPDGEELVMDMVDDGSAFDLAADDGVYGAKFVASESGMWRFTTLFEGTLEDGTPFMRSAEHGMVVVNDDIDIPQGKAAKLLLTRAPADADQIPVVIPVHGGAEGMQVRAYAEVYGTDPTTKALKPACWIGGYTLLKNGGAELEVNRKWLAGAGVTEPLVLKNVYLSDADVHVPVAAANSLAVVSDSLRVMSLAARVNRTRPVAVPTEEMLKGVRPAHLYPAVAQARRRKAAALANATMPSLVLLHGYCAQDNPWVRKKPIPFTDYVAYGNFKQSVLTNKYAQHVIELYGHFPSWGLLGHSQGGMVSLHLHNFYWSPNDAASPTAAGGNRPVQSMGTPYLGVSGAGAALDLGTLFGIGCGENFDLTTDGANLWLAGIQHSAKNELFFYTTQYKQSGLHPRYCNLAVNLVLKWPNDGTVEIDHCKLPGATYVSNTQGECHSVNMKHPPQTENLIRNREINDAAAR